jgi:ABC-2 type transport system ATP-binding protein
MRTIRQGGHGAGVAEVLLDVRSLSKQYGRVHAVRDVSFRIARGEIVCLLGPNGSGKTTTLTCALGMARPTSGSIHVRGRRMGRAAERLTGVGALFDTPAVYPHLTARENLRYVAMLRGIGSGEIDGTLDRVGLSGAGNRPVRGFSFGMRKRLGLAGALLGSPDLLVLDEPTAGMDPEGIRDFRMLLGAAAEEGAGILLSTHLLSEAELVATRNLILKGGRIVGEEEVGSASTAPTLLLRASDAVRLEELLRQIETAATLRREDGAVLLSAPEHAPAELTRLLGEAGVWLEELRWVERSLEQIFMERIGSDEPAPSGSTEGST